MLFDGADAADGGAAVGALALDNGLAVFRGALLGVRHRLLFLALHAISFNSHRCLDSSNVGHVMPKPVELRAFCERRIIIVLRNL